MPHFILSAETKATMMANLELELNARKDKLLAMCEAQCASLRSRLERRVNRVPNNKRNIKLIDLMEPAPVQKQALAKKEKDVPAAPAPALNARRTRPAPATATASSTAASATVVATITKTVRKATATTTKTTRGIKRPSDEIEDKENNAELSIPKKRAKAAPATRATRSTRAASKKVDAAPQILSPKTNNARPVPATRTRRQR
ncbi:hypothetical protein K491DRAFT_772919 [Lophiostoma macrostomum CBS 122681]|uniref:Borealin N-terminal domain-containing protein n=1 Tax=Lophiostoma macrostomum CBS 122681 TaxID=1314788 RepID=A0A6A6TSL6_9PLEO|nr:hypothetical protein K491DRAFT_772919 [Lophiostoma macrostomum CBS 122681]